MSHLLRVRLIDAFWHFALILVRSLKEWQFSQCFKSINFLSNIL